MIQIPDIVLNSNKQVSSLWIAKACGVRHADVRRDILVRSRMGKEFSANWHETTEILLGGGRPAKVIWLSIPQSLILMSSYEGEKAHQARNICLSFLDASFAQNIPGYKAQHGELYEGTKLEIESYDDENDPEYQQMKALRETMTKQMQHHVQIKRIEKQVKIIDSNVKVLNESDGDSDLTNTQKIELEKAIRRKVAHYGGVYKVGSRIKRSLKEKFIGYGIGGRTHKEIPRRLFESALQFVNAYIDEKEEPNRERNLQSLFNTMEQK